MLVLPEAKRAARAAALAARKAAAAAAPDDAAERLADHALAAAPGLRPGMVASGYLPVRSEIDPLPLMRRLHAAGCRLCVPVIEAPERPLRFRAWHPRVALERGAFGIAVPAEGPWLEPQVLFVPLLAFDDVGHRLGYGGGFYDRTLAGLRARRVVRAVGLAYADQRVTALPRDGLDMHLDAVATERGVPVPA